MFRSADFSRAFVVRQNPTKVGNLSRLLMLDLNPATFEDFELEAQCGNVVPVVRSVLADLQTPVGAFLRIAGDASYAFLLESIEGGERVARYSFLGANPWMVARGQGAKTILEIDGRREVRDQNAVEFLREYFLGKKLAQRAGLAPLVGRRGWISRL